MICRMFWKSILLMIMMMNGDDGMNEKRFTLGYVCGDFGLIDNDEWIDLHSMSENSEKNVRICINKMNELADENGQLKQSNKELLLLVDTLKEQNMKFKLRLDELGVEYYD